MKMQNKKKIRVMVILGTRPEAIKLAPLIKELKKNQRTVPVVVTTSQHREIQDDILNLFSIKVNYDLDIMRNKQTLVGISRRAISGVYRAIAKFSPHLVLIQGDTTTSFIGALAAFYSKIAVAHVEAGLRTYQKYNPYPEEKNRHLITVLSDIHFAPTKISVNNLLRENVPKERIVLTGNTVIDSFHWIARFTNKGLLREYFPESLLSSSKKFLLITAHRRENWGRPLENIASALKELVSKHSDIEIVYPVHPQPNVKRVIYRYLKPEKRIHLIEPLIYKSFIALMKQAYFVLTDSGGIQEEASCLGKPVLVLREYTERPEGIHNKTMKLVGTAPKKIVKEATKLLNDEQYYRSMSKPTDAFGDGKASGRIVKAIIKYFNFVK